MTSDTSDWWDIALDPTERATDTRQIDADGVPLINAPDADGRLALDYTDYLGLGNLLGAQNPASRVPDERIFLVVHQLCEVAFKQMVFDLTVVSKTLEHLLRMNDDALHALALAEGEVDDADSDAAAFWRPAITASNRLRHTARSVLPPILALLGRNDERDILFSTLEFGLFRALLAPSSGFQSAQLRLIQRALGKGPLHGVRVFPGDIFGTHYTGSPCPHIAMADPLVLRDDTEVASPPPGHPAAYAARLDAIAHALMARLPQLGAEAPRPPSVRRIHADDVARTVDRFRSTLGLHARAGDIDAEGAVETFAGDLTAATDAENARRDELADARAGAYFLHARAPRSALLHVLSRIAALDTALHAPQADAFLSVHRHMVRRHVADDGGTGGGGMPYLVTSQRYLLPLFPALVAFLDLDDPIG